ncbi:unnamed protein product [Rhodiola kirilowii]
MFRLLVLFTFLFCSQFDLIEPLNDEGYALLSFKNSITQDIEGSLRNWNSSDSSPCTWNGITCKDGIVVALSIPKKKLYGFLPSSLASLSQLRHVNLRNNRLYGGLPVALFDVQGLQSLVLYGNSFTGSLPLEIGKVKTLQNLDLSQNLFNGSMPRTLLECRRLRILDLSRNNFTGSLPDEFGSSLDMLEKLDISYNKFSGLIPDDIGKLSNLQGTVDFSHNEFSGVIPSSLGNLPEKVYIDLTYNNLSGAIPQNGALVNRGPTAFLGNPGLCGPPLKTPCSTLDASSPSSLPFLPGSNGLSDNSDKGSGLSKSSLIAIVVADVIGICLVGWLFSCCYYKVCASDNDKDDNEYGIEKGGKECLCFRKDDSETLSENVERYDLIPLDNQLTFNLDELLKASAFVLGKSGIGIMYKVVLEDGLTLAVRRLGEGGSQRLKEFQTEVEAIGKLRHPNIVTLRAYYWSVDEKLLIYDYIPNGSLASSIHGKAGTASFEPLSWLERSKIMKGVAKGLVYLHEFSPKKYVHGDLKPSNILLDHHLKPYISNFGLGRLANITGGTPTLQSSRMITEKHQPHQPDQLSEVVTIHSVANSETSYLAPEALKALKPSQKWDVYSYGVILLEMISGRSSVVHMGGTDMDLVHWIQLCIEEKKPLPDVLDPYLAEEVVDKEDEIIAVLKIALACVQNSPERRPVMKHVLDTLDKLLTS